MSASTAGSSVAGPRVATILVRRAGSSFRVCRIDSSRRRDLPALPRPAALAFDELEECAAAGGDVGDSVLDAVFLDRGQRVAATGQRERLAARDGVGDRARAFAELVELEHADRAVPQHGAGLGDELRETFGGIRTDVENQLVGPDVVDAAHIGMRRGGEFRGDDHVGGQRNVGAALARARHQPCGRCRACPSRTATCRRARRWRRGTCWRCRRRRSADRPSRAAPRGS